MEIFKLVITSVDLDDANFRFKEEYVVYATVLALDKALADMKVFAATMAPLDDWKENRDPNSYINHNWHNMQFLRFSVLPNNRSLEIDFHGRNTLFKMAVAVIELTESEDELADRLRVEQEDAEAMDEGYRVYEMEQRKSFGWSHDGPGYDPLDAPD